MIRYAGLTILENPTGKSGEASAAYLLAPDGLKGWREGAPDATNVMDHWSGDGTVAMAPRLGARTIEVTGSIVAPPAAMDAALDALQAARRGTFEVNGFETDVARTDLDLTRLSASVYEFVLYLRADDPIRYRAETVALPAGGYVSLPNSGDVTSLPLVTIVGPVAGLTIEHPRGDWHLNHDVGAGQVWEAAFRDGDLWWGGFRQFVPSSGPSPVVPVGGGVWRANYTGSGQVTVRRYEARS